VRNARTITLEWYRSLTEWFEVLRSGGRPADERDDAVAWVERTRLYGGILNLAGERAEDAAAGRPESVSRPQ